jgi:secondary thiamine-phosphate synthase enzyme
MKFFTQILKLKTNEELEFMNITDQVKDILEQSNIANGVVNIYSKHTTLSVEINEYEKLLLKDIDWFMKKLVPEEREYCHDNIELRENCPPDEPKNAKGHLRTLLLETSQAVPIINSEIQLGQYQQIFAVETSGPRDRELIIQIFGEGKNA